MPPVHQVNAGPAPVYAANSQPQVNAGPAPVYVATPRPLVNNGPAPVYVAGAGGSGRTPSPNDPETPPPDARDKANDVIDENNDAIDDLQQKLWEEMQAADRRNSAAIEGQFYTGMALREAGQQGQNFADGFVKFVETREQVALNKLESRNGREEIPFPDAVSDWVSFGEDLKAREDREEERMDRIGDLMEGELPDRARES